MKNLIVILVAAFSLIALTSSTAQAQKWDRLGARDVNFRADHDEIPVTFMEGRFTKLKLVVRDAPIYIKNIRVVYGNGESTNIVVNKTIAKNTESRPFDLPGDKRIIKKIKFNYKSVPNFRGKGRVVVWGRH